MNNLLSGLNSLVDFIFAAWVANKPLPPDFLAAFNDANRLGISQIDEVTRSIGYTAYDLNVYYKENIVYELDEQKREGLSKFLSLI
ncbi:MAG: hypothetical protein EBZ77_01485 [Chitinophagia bacterium]|nr:hypothetical protein [Chitinophagia bacterium]